MAWSSFAGSNNTAWGIDPDHVAQIFYARAFATYKQSHSRIISHERIFGPNTYEVEINHQGMGRAARSQADGDYERFWRIFSNNSQRAYNKLINARIEAIQAENNVRNLFRTASHRTSQAIEQSVGRGEIAVAAARTVRDICSTTLVVGSAFLSGGASLAVLGGGSALTGTGTYQDTGNVGAAVLSATTSFVFGLIPITQSAMVGSRALTTAESRVMIFLGVHNDIMSGTVTSLAQGENLRTSVRNAVIGAGANALVSTIPDSWFDSIFVPALVEGAERPVAGQALQIATQTEYSIVAGQLTSPPAPTTRGNNNIIGAVLNSPSNQSNRGIAEQYVRQFAMIPNP